MNRYLELNKLEPVDKPKGVILEKFLNLKQLSNQEKSFYYKKIVSNGENSFVLFNANEGKLWVTIEYNDEEQ